MNEKMPILAHGEKYIKPIVKKRGPEIHLLQLPVVMME